MVLVDNTLNNYFKVKQNVNTNLSAYKLLRWYFNKNSEFSTWITKHEPDVFFLLEIKLNESICNHTTFNLDIYILKKVGLIRKFQRVEQQY